MGIDAKKLDKWAELLLDTGKRSNLVNFRDTKNSTVEVLFPSSDTLFEKVDGSASFEIFDPKIAENDDEPEEAFEPEQTRIDSPEEPDSLDDKAAFLSQYSGKIRRQHQLLLYNTAKTLSQP